MYNRPRCREWVVPLSTQQTRLRNLIKITGQNIQCNNADDKKTNLSTNSDQVQCNNDKIEFYYTLHLTNDSAAFYVSEKLKLHGKNSQLNWNEINCEKILKSNSKFVCVKVWQHEPVYDETTTRMKTTSSMPSELVLSSSSSCSPPISPMSKMTMSSTMPLLMTSAATMMAKLPISSKLMSSMSSSQPPSNDTKLGTLESSELENTLDFLENTQNEVTNDKLLFIWGVYFSGLILLNLKKVDNVVIMYKKNSLTFKMHCGMFVAPESLLPETQRHQLTINYQLELNENCNILPTGSSGSDKNSAFKINSPRTSRSCSPERNFLNSPRVPARSFPLRSDYMRIAEQTGSNNRSTSNTSMSLIKRDTNSVIEQALESDASVPSTSLPVKDDSHLLEMLKIRYLSKKFPKSEIRSSYTLKKLLQLQEKQRTTKKCQEESKGLIDEISLKSPACLNLDLISDSSKNKMYYNRSTYNNRNPKRTSMGRTLNKLLFQDTQIKPEDLMKSQEIKSKIEIARFRTTLLRLEVDNLKLSNLKLNKVLSELHDQNIEQESWLMSCYRNLSRQKEFLEGEKFLFNGCREDLQKIQIALRQRKAQLCCELKEIYPIEKHSGDRFRINNLFLPNSDDIIVQKYENITPLALSSALGYVAHLVQMCSIILNLPLRNPIKHEGSRSRILDVVKDISNSSREFPLYTRSNPPQKQVIYAIYLLNQNISQLNLQANGIARCDLKATLFNLLQLLNGPGTLGQFLLQPSYLGDDQQNQSSETSGSSIDLNIVPCSGIILRSKPVDVIGDKFGGTERISRSVGSYSNDLSENCPEKFFYNSEPILNQNQVAVHFDDDGNI